MVRSASIPSRSLFVLAFLAAFALPVAAATDAHLIESYGKFPLQFEANQGQTDESVRFLSRGAGYSLYLAAGEAVLVLAKPGPVEEPNPDGIFDEHSPPEQRDTPAHLTPVALRMRLVGAAPAPTVSGLDELPGRANYFIGNDPAKWRTNVPTYAKVHYREVYPGIDLVYYGNQRQLEYDFVVAPGADPQKIVLGVEGADKIEIDAQGELVLHIGASEIRQHKPIIYQQIDGTRRNIDGGYVLKGAEQVGFEVAAYDTSLPLVIDPVLVYSTYLGGSSNDAGLAVAVDGGGNAFVTGHTHSLNFPTSSGAFQPSYGAGTNAFVTKLSPDGSSLVYSTYLGGSDTATTEGRGIAVDAAGNAYVTGFVNSIQFPITAGAFQPVLGGQWDAFLTKLNPGGSALLYSTYLGGSGGDSGSGVAVDTSGNAYVTGSTNSTNFPTTAGAFQTTSGGSDDAFIAKLNPTASTLVYSTYLGGSRSEVNRGIAVDAAGNAYVSGYTPSTDFPTTLGAFQTNFGGGSHDAFVTKINAAGSALVYSTYLGGSGTEGGLGIAVDTSGNAYVTGLTGSTNFPTTPGAFQSTVAGGGHLLCGGFFGNFGTGDAFVTKLNSTGSALHYSTHLGGTRGQCGLAISMDSFGNAYVTGVTSSPDFPTTPGAFQPTFGGDSDVFLTKLNPTGSGLAYSTFLGGPGFEVGLGIAVDSSGNVYTTGFTNSPDFPITPGAFQPTFGGTSPGPGSINDAFVTKFALGGSTRFEEGNPAVTHSPPYSWAWVPRGAEIAAFSGGTAHSSDVTGATNTFTFSGTEVRWIGLKCNLCGIATVSIDGAAPVSVDTASAAAPGSAGLAPEVVFTASDLANARHTLVISVTGTTSSGGVHIAVDAFDVNVIRSEQNSPAIGASPGGAWVPRGADVAAFSGGSASSSDFAGANVVFTFIGTAVSWTGLKCNVCGIATVSIDGAAPVSVNTAGSAAPGSSGLASEPMFTAAGLAAGTTHTMAITVIGATTSAGNHIAVDAFDVTP